MMRVSSNLRSPLHAGQTRMALSSSSITRSPPLRIALEPGECPGQAVVEHRARRPSEDGLSPCGVEHAPPLLTLTRGCVPGRRANPGELREPPVQLVDRGLEARADVRDAGRRMTAERAGDRVGHVLDEDVVARLVAVAVDETRLAGEQPMTEDRDDAGLAVRILTWAVDVGQAKRERRAPRQSRPALEVAFGGDLRDSVGRCGPGRVIFRRGQDVGIAVSGATGRRVHDAADARAPRRLQDVGGADDVHSRVEGGIGDGARDGGLGGRVDHRVGSLRGHDGAELRAPDVADVQRGGRAHVGASARAEIVDDGDAMAIGEQTVHHVRTDEASASGDEDLHAPSFRRNHSSVSRRPSSASTRGSQPRSARAREMSGWRTLGSSTGSGRNTISLWDDVRRMIHLARSRSVISWGLPMFTGSWTALFISRQRPSMRSSMYWNERVWEPSPKTVSGLPVRAWDMNAGIARPSFSLILGPNVLKILTMRVSTPWARWYAIVMASAYRLASSYTPRGPMGLTLPQ